MSGMKQLDAARERAVKAVHQLAGEDYEASELDTRFDDCVRVILTDFYYSAIDRIAPGPRAGDETTGGGK